jgi:hypothetical protein
MGSHATNGQNIRRSVAFGTADAGHAEEIPISRESARNFVGTRETKRGKDRIRTYFTPLSKFCAAFRGAEAARKMAAPPDESLAAAPQIAQHDRSAEVRSAPPMEDAHFCVAVHFTLHREPGLHPRPKFPQ